MTAKVTLSFSDDTIEEARRFARREGMSLSAWMDQAAREKALREVFAAHATAVGRAALDFDNAALADEREIEMVDEALFGAGNGSGGNGSGGNGPGGNGRGRRRAA
jgi:hypothetical protein